MRTLRYVFMVHLNQCCCRGEDDRNVRDKRHESMFSLTDCANHRSPIPSMAESSPSCLPSLKLLLEVRESAHLPAGRTYHITETGLKDSTKRLMDGKTIIGRDSELCDILIAADPKEIGRAHCCIDFDTRKRTFRLKDLGDGQGTFLKIEDHAVLQNGDLLSFGDTLMSVSISPNSSEAPISLRFYEGPKAGQVLKFNPGDDIIRIGRVRDCSIIIEDSNLSRYQCLLAYHDTSGWVLTDGDGCSRSANGTWYLICRLYLDHEMEVTQGMIIRVGRTVFRVRGR